ncbi:hypothetical protein AXW67_37650 [Bradyrhizobium neotropicale]|uniref:Uncharacterized protein n=1 Tax=Bradyrhizobium neotropicale TaxID=1497615 RepID=A0A176ZH05_9BRAD|nr:hypothetical protein AXW67_37650 [Bradyrhizobium neotropicale]
MATTNLPPTHLAVVQLALIGLWPRANAAMPQLFFYWQKNGQLQFGPACKIKCHLLIAEKAVLRMIEGPRTTLARQHALLVP